MTPVALRQRGSFIDGAHPLRLRIPPNEKESTDLMGCTLFFGERLPKRSRIEVRKPKSSVLFCRYPPACAISVSVALHKRFNNVVQSNAAGYMRSSFCPIFFF